MYVSPKANPQMGWRFLICGLLGLIGSFRAAGADSVRRIDDLASLTPVFSSRTAEHATVTHPKWTEMGPFAEGSTRGQPCGDLSLTQNFDDQLITTGATFECLWANANNPSEKCISAGNAMARSYDLSAGPTAGLDVIVRCVTFGVELNGDGNPNCSGRPASDYDVTLNLYVDTDEGSPTLPGVDLSLLGSVVVTVPAQAANVLMTAVFPSGVNVAADSILVVEIFLPDRHPLLGGDSGLFFLGSNSAGESAPSYIRGLIQGCMYPNFRTYQEAGHPETHVLQTIGLDLVNPCIPVLIATQPTSDAVCEGDTIEFSVGISGSPPFTYQWRKDGVGIPGATSGSLAITSVSVDDPGNYDVTVTNDCGLAISDTATLVAWPAASGDVNGDNAINGADIGPFVEVLLTTPNGPPALAFCAADMNEDGIIASADVDLLIIALLGP